MKKGDEENIKELVERWNISPRVIDQDVKKAFYYIQLKDYKKAVEYIDKALKSGPKSISLLYIKGFMHKRYLRNFREAKICFRALLGLNPLDEFEWRERGAAFVFLENDREALKSFDKATEINPKYIWAWFNKGYVHHGLGQFKESLKCLDKIIEIDPNNEGALINKGNILGGGYPPSGQFGVVGFGVSGNKKFVNAWRKWKPKYKEAMDCYEKVLEINPRDISTRFKKIELLEKMPCIEYQRFKGYKDILELCGEILKIDYGNIQALLKKAETLEQRVKDPLFGILTGFSDKNILKELENYPGWGNFGFGLGFYPDIYRKETYGEVLNCYKEILKLDPHNGDALYRKASILADELKRPKVALKYINKALNLDNLNDVEKSVYSSLKNKILHQLNKSLE